MKKKIKKNSCSLKAQQNTIKSYNLILIKQSMCAIFIANEYIIGSCTKMFYVF